MGSEVLTAVFPDGRTVPGSGLGDLCCGARYFTLVFLIFLAFYLILWAPVRDSPTEAIGLSNFGGIEIKSSDYFVFKGLPHVGKNRLEMAWQA